MSIVTEYYMTRSDGVVLNRTYSDRNKIIVRNDGVEFSEAIDIDGIGYTYTESEKSIPQPGFPYDPDEATEADYQEALRELGAKL